MTEARRFLVSGRVQGVGFRAATRGVARELGLSGHAINLPDGRVEVVAEGPVPALDALQAWLGRGPLPARVDGLTAERILATGREGFRTG